MARPWAAVGKKYRAGNLEQNCKYLAIDLAYKGPDEGVGLPFRGWEFRACQSAECPDRHTCVFHLEKGEGVAEGLNLLIDNAIARRCLGDRQFVGRSVSAFEYWPILDKFGVAFNDRSRLLLTELGR